MMHPKLIIDLIELFFYIGVLAVLGSIGFGFYKLVVFLIGLLF